MKNLFIILILLLSFGQTTFADENASSSVIVRTTEKVPGVPCSLEEGAGKEQEDGTMQPIIYECSVPRGSGGITMMLGNMIKYATFIVGLLGVMFIVYSGVMYSMGGANDGLKSAAKERISKTIIGLVVLLLSGYILQFLAPWVYK